MSAKKPSATYPSVLIIDDNPIDNIINEKMIMGCGFAERVYINTGSRSALEFLRNFERSMDSIPAELVPSIIFLDINMPIMDGFQFIEEFKSISEKLRVQVRVMMLTTSTNPVDLEAASNHHLIEKFYNKPLTEAMLEEIAQPTRQ